MPGALRPLTEMEHTVIRTVLKTAVVTATLAGASLAVTAPASADTHWGDNNNHTRGGNAVVNIIGGYGVNCGSASVGGQSTTNCNGNSFFFWNN